MAIDATYVNGQSVLSQDKSAMPDAAWINGLSTYWINTVAGGGCLVGGRLINGPLVGGRLIQ